MNTFNKKSTAQQPIRSYRRTILLVLVLLLSCRSGFVSAKSVEPLFGSPPRAIANDEVFVLSTRVMGTACSDEVMRHRLQCKRLVTKPTGQKFWRTTDWRQVLSVPANLPTIVYVHGNRVAPGQDRAQGMQVYRSLKAHTQLHSSIRFVIWSWPSSQIRGPIKDYLVKARRTNPAAWQLSWLLDKLPVETPIALVGYSYGTRVVTGATHLLAGGRIGQLHMSQRTHVHRPPMRAALLAAAYDADWIQPGHLYGRSVGQLERLVLGTNRLDPAMRFYHLSNGRGRMDALGKSGVYQLKSLGTSAHRLKKIDFTSEVGRSHLLTDYLAINGKMRVLWRELTASQYLATNAADAESGQTR